MTHAAPAGSGFRRTKDILVMVVGAICLLSQVVGYLLGIRISIWLIFAGLTCFGYQLALTADRTRIGPKEADDASE
jgi:hypothetical protein